MSNIDRLNEEQVATLTSLSRFLRNMGRAGTSFSVLIQAGDNRAKRCNLAAFLAAGCPKITIPNDSGEAKPATPYDLATMILGRDFVSPKEITAKYSSIVYTEEQLDAFESALPSREDLEWLRDNNFILLPGPNSSLSLLDIRNLNTAYFYAKTGGWYAEEKQTFVSNDKTEVRWIALRKEAVPGSYSKNWEEQKALLSGLELVPNAAEAVWCITAYKAVRNINLFRSTYVRTSSLIAVGFRVGVGYFDGKGLSVDYYWGGHRRDGLGLASARKFPISQQS